MKCLEECNFLSLRLNAGANQYYKPPPIHKAKLPFLKRIRLIRNYKKMLIKYKNIVSIYASRLYRVIKQFYVCALTDQK